MDIILGKDDIESLIKENFDGVNSIKIINKTIKIVLDVDASRFIKKSNVKARAIGSPVIDPKEVNNSGDNISHEEKLDIAKQKRLMGPGERVFIN